MLLILLITCNFTLRCTELGLRIYLPFVCISTQAFGAGRLTERGTPGAANERVDTVRKNESVLLCSSFRCTCRFEEEAHVQYLHVHVHVGASVTA